ncbi:hypothetical protein CLV80_11045 [Yoonia maritima]|uniref:Outer membrane protein n=1 Tax=Yoonia maritima TaxID=1435347 RepID=A0A2T0VW71_9RHOB|nr:hypothetical protein [Yoonia maritima]PRY75959.1 hypothetical protein CLV80_11045 [Yoonia maritima]
MNTTFASCVAVLVSCTAVQAQEAGDMSVGLGVSTFGGNLEASYVINEQFRVRGALMGGFSYEDSGSEPGDGSYEFDASLGGFAVLADYYPTQSGWRVSGGLFLSNTDFTGVAEASAANPIEIDGTEYTSGSVTTKSEFNNTVAPVLTTGYDLHFADNWTFSSEIGAIFIGGVDLSAKSDDATLQAEIDSSDDYAEARDDADDLNIYPYLSLGLAYRF